MGMGRKKALERIEGLIPRVEAHLREIEEKPESWALSHWKHEIRNWLQQMEDVLSQVGRKTAEQWAQYLAQCRARLEGKNHV